MTKAKRDYSLVGEDSKRAIALGLAAADWYHTELPRKRMKELMRRKNMPAIRDTVLWFALLGGFAFGGSWFWGSWLAAPFFLCYGVLYGSASDSRWHESGHGTVFRTPWLNEILYQIASFMNMREATLWRWSHARHHSDTIIVGRDREIAGMRPPDVLALILNVFGIRDGYTTFNGIAHHIFGHVNAEEANYIPQTERRRVYWEARIHLAMYVAAIGSAIYLQSILPLMYVGLPSFYGRFFSYYFALTQHTGLAENVLDHRLNSRTIYMNPVFRFIYWNMNYHVEHHMFPMVPYHALPQLHREVLYDMPAPYKSTIAAYREMLPTLWRQVRDPEYYVRRKLPSTARSFQPDLHRVVFEG
jgi:fatty acid desaturase